MSDEDDIELVTGVPAGTELRPIAGGSSEFKADPSQFMNLVEGIDLNHTRKMLGKKPVLGDSIQDQSGQASNKDAMRSILERLPDFHDSATYAVEKSLRDPQTKTNVKRAIITEGNADREWQIRVDESISGKTLYSVVNINARKSFFKELYLQGAAKKLCQLLENGAPLNSSKVSKVLYFDEVYRKHYDEAMSFKKHYKSATRNKDRTKADIYENKFEVARSKAVEAKTNLKNIR